MRSQKNWNIFRRLKHLLPHTSHLSPHTSHLLPLTSYLTPLTSYLTPHTSHLTPHTSYLTPHTSHLSPHTSHLLPLTFCLFLLSALCISCGDIEEKLYGTWSLQSVLMNGEPLNDSLQFNLIPKHTDYTFAFANRLNVSTYALGEPFSSADGFYTIVNNSTIEMTFTLLFEKYNIKATIKKLNKKALNLEYEDKGNYYFLYLYPYYNR